MGFLSRLSSRAGLDPVPAPLAMPKGVVARRSLPPSHATIPIAGEGFPSPRATPTGDRQELGIAEFVQTPSAPDMLVQARPSVVPHAEPATAPLVRRQEEEQDGEDPVMLHRQVEVENEEEDAAMLRRQMEVEQPVQASVHHQVEEEEEEALKASSTLRRSMAAPTHDAPPRPGSAQHSRESGSVPLAEGAETGIAPHRAPANHDGATPRAAQPAPDPVRPHQMQAIDAANAAPSPSMEFGRRAEFFRAPEALADRSEPFDPPDTGTPAAVPGRERERPQVVIDQIDVLIHEQAPSPASPAPRADPDRSLRARYLRRL